MTALMPAEEESGLSWRGTKVGVAVVCFDGDIIISVTSTGGLLGALLDGASVIGPSVGFRDGAID
eukprot:CAMPEP_0201939398 /NCGR_PEP_ID=MMETSP0903-20130614/43136_1 /ASSEMBLY_ACC=CAM_ASM_000552 /TAXON_ID=420261 /ORGANISM="Thalassiosira antarctica, Strain CCMP982" /LENGTH=64 /DNA_ID=CAMNT_0048480915 /DNA_START=354 /DNA_END=545 /DNA_ORIENTATION=-